jgi:hypothetical protein
MASPTDRKLKTLVAELRPGAPVFSRDLARLGVSAALASYYVQSGWLERLGRRVYALPGRPLELEPSLVALEGEIEGLHVGGKTALDWHGYRQYVAQRSVVQLYGWLNVKMPRWFTSRFPCAFHRKRLFHESPRALLGVGRFEDRPDAPLTSTPERALLEVLSEVGVRQSLDEVREMMQSMFTLRSDLLTQLLQHCKSVKTVRLCLNLGRELKLPWAPKLDPALLPTGSDSLYVTRSRDGVLVLKA